VQKQSFVWRASAAEVHQHVCFISLISYYFRKIIENGKTLSSAWQDSAKCKGHFSLLNCLVLGHIKYSGFQRVYCNQFPAKQFHGSHRTRAPCWPAGCTVRYAYLTDLHNQCWYLVWLSSCSCTAWIVKPDLVRFLFQVSSWLRRRAQILLQHWHVCERQAARLRANLVYEWYHSWNSSEPTSISTSAMVCGNGNGSPSWSKHTPNKRLLLIIPTDS
jgi:hypothetical protein